MNILKRIWRWLFGKKAEPPLTPLVSEELPIAKVDEVVKDKLVTERRKRKLGGRSTVIRTDNLSGKYPPRSMTEREKELYDIKPNLQYWINKGEL